MGAEESKAVVGPAHQGVAQVLQQVEGIDWQPAGYEAWNRFLKGDSIPFNQ